MEDSLYLASLESRRRIGRFSLFHKICHSSLPFRRTHIVTADRISPRIDHPNKVNLIFARASLYKYSPIVLTITEWNALSYNLAVAQDYQAFF